jgi:signal transduction histidine kinase
MAMLKMEIEGMRNHDGLAAVVRSRLDRLGGDLDLAIRSVRDLTDELSLRSFDVWNLVIRLFELADDVNHRGWAFADCSVGVEVEQLRHVPPEIAYAAYNVAREAVFNSMRHSACDTVVLRLEVVAGRLVLEVTDNGVGVDGSVAGIGRTSMGERVSAVGGLLEVLDRSPFGTSGTCVRASFALPEERGAGR